MGASTANFYIWPEFLGECLRYRAAAGIAAAKHENSPGEGRLLHGAKVGLSAGDRPRSGTMSTTVQKPGWVFAICRLFEATFASLFSREKRRGTAANVTRLTFGAGRIAIGDLNSGPEPPSPSPVWLG